MVMMLVFVNVMSATVVEFSKGALHFLSYPYKNCTVYPEN